MVAINHAPLPQMSRTVGLRRIRVNYANPLSVGTQRRKRSFRNRVFSFVAAAVILADSASAVRRGASPALKRHCAHVWRDDFFNLLVVCASAAAVFAMCSRVRGIDFVLAKGLRQLRLCFFFLFATPVVRSADGGWLLFAAICPDGNV